MTIPMTIRGSCEACGKGYRLPSAERTYACKACGGTVRAEDPDLPPAAEDVEPEPDHHETAREHRARIDAIHRAAARKSRLIWVAVVLLVACAVGVAYQLTR